MKAEIVAPAPGSMPTIVPMTPPRAIVGASPLGSLLSFSVETSAASSCTMLASPVRSSSWLTENRPISAGMSLTPSNSSGTLPAKRG